MLNEPGPFIFLHRRQLDAMNISTQVTTEDVSVRYARCWPQIRQVVGNHTFVDLHKGGTISVLMCLQVQAVLFYFRFYSEKR